MDSDAETLEIVRVIVMLAHHLGLKVVAEGVETRAQLDLLKQLGCERAQGYLFPTCRPPGDPEASDNQPRRGRHPSHPRTGRWIDWRLTIAFPAGTKHDIVAKKAETHQCSPVRRITSAVLT